MVSRNAPIGINQLIYDTLIANLSYFENYHFNTPKERQTLLNFLASTGFEERKKYAVQIIENTLIKHRKNRPLEGVLKRIHKIEEGTQHFDIYVRDHVAHSVYVYLSGIMLDNLIPRTNRLVDPFAWKLSSILHDFGYPPQLLYKGISDYLDSINFRTKYNPPVGSNIIFQDISKLVLRPDKPQDAFDLIQNRIDEWEIRINIKDVFNSELRHGHIDHGILGSILLIKKLDELYTDNNPSHLDYHVKTIRNIDINWGRMHFDNEVVNAITSIALHNLILYASDCVIEYTDNPLLFLLVLSDTIQEWDRYSPGQRVFDPYCVNIQENENRLVFEFHLPIEKKNYIRSVFIKLRINGEHISIE